MQIVAGRLQAYQEGSIGWVIDRDASFQLPDGKEIPFRNTVVFRREEKEDSKLKAYLIENGTKRWVSSPRVFLARGQSWADVKVVPDGALDRIPTGQDLLG